jgi:hypothetical protein
VLRHLLIPYPSIDAGQRPGEHMAHWFRLFDPVKCKEYITFDDNSKGKVVSCGTTRVNKSFIPKDVVLVLNLHFNLLLVLLLLQDSFEVHFKTSLSRVLNSQRNLVCQIVPFGHIF